VGFGVLIGFYHWGGVEGMGLRWYRMEKSRPGEGFKPQPGYLTTEFVVVYHHGDNELMTNMAFWNGERFVIGTTCYCYECDCDCNYPKEYSEECVVTHWAEIELPEIGMEIYFEEL
jgi:hypothetical protein